MKYQVNIGDIEQALHDLGGEARPKEIQDRVLKKYCGGLIPENYKNERSFRMTIERKIEDYCPQSKDFNPVRKEGKFLRIPQSGYRFANGHHAKEFPAIEEVPEADKFFEGATKTISVNYYERSPEARKKCIEHHGVKCCVCDFDFAHKYGKLGESFIHVHHIVPLSEIQSSYIVDAVKDLRPVCANCHAIIHRTSPALPINELKDALIAAANA